MLLKNALKKIEAAGYKALHVRGERNKTYQVDMGGRTMEFMASSYGGDVETIDCIGVRNTNDLSDPMTDYCAYVFYNTLTQALRLNK